MTTGYIICTTPRSGSTLLCTVLEATGRAGRPDSFYHEPHFMAEWAASWGLPEADGATAADYDAAYLNAAYAAGRGGTSSFGMRVQHDHLATLTATLGRLYPDAGSDAERFGRAFGALRYLHLTRSDKVAQAVSLVKARQSGLWHRHADGSERERNAPAAEPRYDAGEIGAAVAALTAADQGWNAWFAQEKIEPFRLSYEAFERTPTDSICGIFALLGLTPPAPSAIVPGVAKLADETSREWVERYRAEHVTSGS